MKALKLQPGESIIHSTPMIWRKYIFPVFMALVMAMVIIDIIALADFSNIPDVIALAANLLIELLFLFWISRIFCTRYIVTNRNVHKVTGIFKKDITTVPISSCLNVMIQMNFRQRIFGGGNIHLQTGEKDVVLKNVQNPIRFRLKVMEQMTKELFNADTYAEHLKSGN